MQAYAERRGIELKSLRFKVDGDTINGEDTPKMVQHSNLLTTEYNSILIVGA